MFDRLSKVFGRDKRPAASSDQKYLDAPGKIDIVSAADTSVTLWLIVNYPWTMKDTYAKLNEKLNHYVWFIEDGQLSHEYPQLAPKRRRICIESMYPLTSKIIQMLPSMRALLLARDIELEVLVADERSNALVEFPITP